jgi:hypothetical protein
MMRRHRHRLDLLPLLDVFIVVLFVFATVHERKIDETVQVGQELANRVAELEGALVDARREAFELQQAPGAQRVPTQTLELQARAQRAEQRLDALREQTEAMLEQWGPGEDAARRLDVFRKLLDHFTVFEIEVSGGGDSLVEVVNECCYRVDMDGASWRSCGSVPADPAQRRAWLDHGAGELVDALRRTKGGNAMTIVRQDPVATHRIGGKLGDLLREQFPTHQIYAGGVAPSEIRCGPSLATER